MEGIDFYGEVVCHCYRVSELVERVCVELNHTELQEELKEAAMVHDVGKFYVKKGILCDKRPLTSMEKMVVDMHSVYGYSVCERLGYSKEICQLVLLHHGIDKWFVNPADILPSVKRSYNILRACDIWDALVSNRVYREALPVDEAYKVLVNSVDLPTEICQAIYRISDMC